MTIVLDPGWHMWVVIAVLAVAMLSFALERVSLEVTSLSTLAVLLLWFQVFPLIDGSGVNLLGAAELLRGFANPSLFAVLALLVMGQAMVQTGALSGLTRMFVRLSKNHHHLAVISGFVGVMLTSAFLNNTPVVVMFIPIMQALAVRRNTSPSRLMMPLSFAAILGGMTTLIGSSTNLLVSSALTDLGEAPLAMFDFLAIGVCMAAVGALYVVFVLPKLLPERGDMARTLLQGGRQFIAEIDVLADSPLVGHQSVAGQFRPLPDITVRLIQRGDHAILPPFEEITLRAGDVLFVAATRQALTEALARNIGYLLASGGPMEPLDNEADGPEGERVLAEVMIAPASRMIDQTVDMVGFRRRFGVPVLGIQRRGRMARRRLSEIRLEAGDVLLIVGDQANVDALSDNPDLVLMAWAIRDVPRLERAPHAAVIFGATVLVAATGLVPIAVAALVGALATIVAGCLNLRQAFRALDRTILVLVGSTLALGHALQATGGAEFIAMNVLEAIAGPEPMINMAVLFLVVAAATNVLSNNACAILFTPIAVSLAGSLGVPPTVMAITVLLAANCSFASPIGYQTNLLVMGPGHYRFADFLKAGVPLTLLMWLTFCLIAPSFFGIVP